MGDNEIINDIPVLPEDFNNKKTNKNMNFRKNVLGIFSALGLYIVFLIGFILITRYDACNKPQPVDNTQRIIDSLLKENKQLVNMVAYYSHQYDSSKHVNDSLKNVGVKTIVKWKTVKEAGDTVEIVKQCDSLAREYEIFVLQTDETIKKADSLITAQYAVTENQKQIIEAKDVKINELSDEIIKWKKLAKRRGRTIEW